MDNGYQASKGEFSKQSLKQDRVFLSMDEFIDDKLQLVGEMVAHKKTLQGIQREKKDEYK